MMKLRPSWLAGIVIVAAAAATVAATDAVLDPPTNDLLVMFVTLLATSGAGLLSAHVLSGMLPLLRLRYQAALVAAFGVLVVVANVAVAAWLMFLSTHDLQVLLLLCGFTVAASAGPAWLMTRPATARIGEIERASRDVAQGAFEHHLAVGGRDEIAHLAAAFTDMEAALEAAARSRDAAEASRRHLYAAISHDLRTPLSSMRAMVEALSDGIVTDPETRDRYLRMVSSEIEHLTVLINDLFELTRIETGALQLRLEWLNLNDFVARALEVFRPQVERAGVRLDFVPGPATGVHADADHLARVIYNLLHNALRHTPHDGTIVLRTEPSDGRMVRIDVSDTGEGIAEADVPFVFDRFFRGDPSRARDGAGSGLGLSIARGIVELHGGRIWVDKTGARGTTIAITLPARAEAALAAV